MRAEPPSEVESDQEIVQEIVLEIEDEALQAPQLAPRLALRPALPLRLASSLARRQALVAVPVGLWAPRRPPRVLVASPQQLEVAALHLPEVPPQEQELEAWLCVACSVPLLERHRHPMRCPGRPIACS
jgi:hypothetical protein